MSNENKLSEKFGKLLAASEAHLPLTVARIPELLKRNIELELANLLKLDSLGSFCCVIDLAAMAKEALLPPADANAIDFDIGLKWHFTPKNNRKWLLVRWLKDEGFEVHQGQEPETFRICGYNEGARL